MRTHKNEISTGPEIGESAISNSGRGDSASGEEMRSVRVKEISRSRDHMGRKGFPTSILSSRNGCGWQRKTMILENEDVHMVNGER